jgi:hypothetical protein
MALVAPAKRIILNPDGGRDSLMQRHTDCLITASQIFCFFCQRLLARLDSLWCLDGSSIIILSTTKNPERSLRPLPVGQKLNDNRKSSGIPPSYWDGISLLAAAAAIYLFTLPPSLS